MQTSLAANRARAQMAQLGLLDARAPELFSIKTLEQFGKHSRDTNQHCFAGLRHELSRMLRRVGTMQARTPVLHF